MRCTLINRLRFPHLFWAIQSKKILKQAKETVKYSFLESFPAEWCVKMDFKIKSDFWGGGRQEGIWQQGEISKSIPSHATRRQYPLLQCWWPCLKMKSYSTVHRSRHTSQTGNWTETRFLQTDCMEWNLKYLSNQIYYKRKSESGIIFSLEKAP